MVDQVVERRPEGGWDGFDGWLAAQSALLGPGRVRLPDEPRGNIGMFASRRVRAVLRPTGVDQVQQIVVAATRADPPVPLYPVSTGRNWGLGSREPVGDGAVLLELADLDRIRHLDPSAGVAVIEPGVTQARLAARLDGTPRMLNLTSSSAHTSVLGNALDRGVGVRRQRCDDLLGLEVVLADGSLMRLGSWPDSRGRAVAYRHELGPALMPLFAQSGLGVITAAAVHLLPRPETLRVIRLAFPRGRLREAMDELRTYHAQRLVTGVPKVYLDTTPGHGEAFCCLDGDADLVTASQAALCRRALASGLFTWVKQVDPADVDVDRAVTTTLARHSGDPSLGEDAFEASFGTPADRVDRDGEHGFLMFLPLVPFDGAALDHAYALVRQVQADTGTIWRVTLNALSPDLVDFVTWASFPREHAPAAHRALGLLHERFAEAGWRPYRLDIDHMHLTGALNGCTRREQLMDRLKDLLDPAHILSPGRYESAAGNLATGCYESAARNSITDITPAG
ncbi:FAD-binding oxidoreductase [Actinomadura gamaensis]|uniref:FAD-binding oxidoreductase n=1 Tax=Actinomadura gamaensis TaxID=1763541 RepID=A0ABV9UCY6_9ACTN